MNRRVVTTALTFVSFLLGMASAAVGQTVLKGAVYTPEAGTICDKKGGFCADAQGISMGITKMYLGEAAQKKLLAMGEFDTTTFTLTNGVHCESKARKCTVSKIDGTVDAAHTKALFGAPGNAGATAAPVKGAVTFPSPGIICDKQVGICADSQGISMAFTEEYLGAAAQQKQMALMRKGGYNQTFFVLSNGVACNTVDKKCYAGEFDSKVDAVHTKALFGK